jgi:SprT-like family
MPKYTSWQHTIGQCWATSASADGHAEIFVSPELGKGQDTRIVGIAAHELVHATVGLEAKHGKLFKRCANAVSLTGRMTATEESLEFETWVRDVVVRKLGPYPAGKLIIAYRKQTTRTLKCECPSCGYLARVTRKWIDEKGAPWCPGEDTGCGQMLCSEETKAELDEAV